MSEFSSSGMNQLQVPEIETSLKVELAEPFSIPTATIPGKTIVDGTVEVNKLSKIAKLLEDEQARLRICQGKLKHAKEDFDRAERDTKDAEDSVEGLRRQLQEMIAE